MNRDLDVERKKKNRRIAQRILRFSINKWCCCDSLAPHYLQNAIAHATLGRSRIRNAHNIKELVLLITRASSLMRPTTRFRSLAFVPMGFRGFYLCVFKWRRAHVSMIKMADCIHFECNSFFHGYLRITNSTVNWNANDTKLKVVTNVELIDLCALWVMLAFDFPFRQSDMSAADTWIRPSRQPCSSPAKSASFVLCCTLSFNVPALWPAQLRWNRCYRKSITWDWAIQHWRPNWLRLV